MPISVAYDNILGSVDRASVFEWRKYKLVSLAVGQLIELNTFDVSKVQVGIRFPMLISDEFNLQVDLGYVDVDSTYSSDYISNTPYRQAGRPSHFELDLGMDFPISEGVGNNIMEIIPVFQMSISLQARLRYLIYPSAISAMLEWEAIYKIFSPDLTTEELKFLSKSAPRGMKIEQNRYDFLFGTRVDLYSRKRFFLHLDNMIAMSYGSLGSWIELSLGIGYAI